MYEETLLVDALYYLCAAVIAVPLFKKIGLGSILGYLCAGVVLGPHVLGLVSDPEEVLHFAEYGVILLLFIIGLELAPQKLWTMRGQIGLIGGSQLVISASVLTGAFYLSALNFQQSLVLGLALGLSSTAFAIQLMSEERILASPLGRKGFSILLLQDLAVIPILLLVGVLAQNGGPGESSYPWYYSIAAVAGVLIFGRFGLSHVLAMVAQTNNREVMTAASLLIVVSVAVLMDAVSLSMGLGAFLAGIMLANSDFRHQIESDIEPFKGILLGLFFIAVGMTLNVDLLLQNPFLMLSAALALITIKTLVIAVVLRRNRVSYKEGFQLGLILSQGGEFAFVILSEASQAGLFSVEISGQVTLVVGLSMALTSPLVVLHRKIWRARSESQPEQNAHWDTHEPEVIIAGFGRFGQIIGRMLSARHIPFTAMDKSPAHVEFVKQFGNRIFFGNMTRLDLMRSAGIKHAKIMVVAVDDIEESLEIVALVKKQNPRTLIIARATDRTHARRLLASGVEHVIRDTFASSLEAATRTLEQLGYPEGRALEVTEMFRNHDETMLQNSVEHIDDVDKLHKLAREGRQELQELFEKDSR
ncbi:MAG: CPA2 family monovalent cation:H+ antiporter-2 [Pseudohongiellaceae bacterium]|jgi:CPA2 family monovalent cation:H+ antiporter-2